MSTPTSGPPASQGFGVVAEALRTLAGFFEDLEDNADGFAGRLAGIGVSGEQTGRCCRQAGDALKSGLRRLAASMDDFGSRALDVREALDGTARGYDQSDAGGAQTVAVAGAGL